MSRLDAVIHAFNEAPMDEGRSRALYATLAGTELCLLLEVEAQGATITPRTFPLDTGPVVLAFDSESRLSDFAGAAPFVAMAGRDLAQLFAGQGIGLGLNLGSGAETVVPAAALDWLAEHQVAARQATGQPDALYPPSDLPEHLLPEIEARVAAAQGLADRAVLAVAAYSNERRPLVGFVGAKDGAETALAALIGEVFAVAGLDPSACDVAFLPIRGALTDRLIATGLVIDIPKLPDPPAPDPTRPPKLR